MVHALIPRRRGGTGRHAGADGRRPQPLRPGTLAAAWLLLAFVGLEVAVRQGWATGRWSRRCRPARLRPRARQPRSSRCSSTPGASRPSDRFPAIVQDVAVIGLFFVVATMLLREQLLATSAVGAVVVGFALQDTLGNLRRPGDPDREAVQGRPLDSRWGSRRPGPGGDLASHQAAHQGWSVSHSAEQLHFERAHPQLLRANGPDADARSMSAPAT